MAKVTGETIKRYYIELNSDEAIWLKGYLQNDITGKECANDRANRAKIWGALEGADVPNWR